jgi:hypothetical protein
VWHRASHIRLVIRPCCSTTTVQRSSTVLLPDHQAVRGAPPVTGTIGAVEAREETRIWRTCHPGVRQPMSSPIQRPQYGKPARRITAHYDLGGGAKTMPCHCCCNNGVEVGPASDPQRNGGVDHGVAVGESVLGRVAFCTTQYRGKLSRYNRSRRRHPLSRDLAGAASPPSLAYYA